jgi:RNA polymerase sigma-70 factor (ECF subfamily)
MAQAADSPSTEPNAASLLSSDALVSLTALDERVVCQRLEPMIRLYGLRRLRDADAVQDFVQEALLALVAALREGRVSDAAQLAPYAVGICRNLVRDGVRKQRRRSELWETYGVDLGEGVEPSPYTTSLGRARLEDCVSKLQRKARDVLRRAFFEQSTNGEIARELGLLEGNVRVIRHRALEQLRDCVKRPLSWSEVP